MLRPGLIVKILAIAGIILAIVWEMPRAAGQSAAVIPSTLFGMTLVNYNDWPHDSVGALGKGALVTWPYSEPQRGVYNWTNLDTWVKTAGDHQVDFFFSNALVPSWAAADQSTCAPTYPNYPSMNAIGCTSTVADIKDWDDFVTALATRYKGKLIYELWNEPNSKDYTGTVAEMVTLTTHEYNIIRSIDPGAVIVSPSPTYGAAGASVYLDQYFSAGGPTGVDVIAWHAYWPTPEALTTNISKMKALMAKYGLSSKPLWDTEGSCNVPATLTADQEAGFVARYYLLQGSMGVSRFYWYAWDSPTFGTMWDSTNGLHPDAIAFQQVYNWMVGATMSGPCTMSSNSTWTCTLTRSGGYQAVAVWNSAGTASYTPDTTYKHYRDLAGNTTLVQGSVIVGYNPILFESQSQPAAPTNLSLTVK
jgi:Cellulase (glycosyl hydrolase family 5)